MQVNRRRIAEVLDQTHRSDRLSRSMNVFLLVLILLNVLAVILESVSQYRSSYWELFFWFELISVMLFSLEYVLRLWACAEQKVFRGKGGRLRFALTPMALVDLFAVLPFFLPMVIPLDLRFLRILRLVRIFSVLKLAKYSSSITLLSQVLVNKKEQLVITFSLALIVLVFVSSSIFILEHRAQPEVFSSIPAAMWWSIGATTRLGSRLNEPDHRLWNGVRRYCCPLRARFVCIACGYFGVWVN